MNYIYIGPTIPNIVIQNAIFSYRPERAIREVAEIEPLARYLFIDMSEIVEKKKELEKDGSLLNVAIQKLRNALNNGGVKDVRL